MKDSIFIDLTHELSDKTPVHPGDSQIVLRQTASIKEDKYRNSTMQLSMHIGTHIDTPGHFLDTSLKVKEYDLTHYIVECVVLDVSGKSIITLEPWMKQKIQPSKGIILYTGHDQYFYEENYFKTHPVIDPEFASYISKHNIPIIGMDMPSPDVEPYPIHQLLLSNDILIVENLTNVKVLLNYKEVTLYALPLKLPTYGSPIRAIAKVSKERTSQ